MVKQRRLVERHINEYTLRFLARWASGPHSVHPHSAHLRSVHR